MVSWKLLYPHAPDSYLSTRAALANAEMGGEEMAVKDVQ